MSHQGAGGGSQKTGRFLVWVRAKEVQRGGEKQAPESADSYRAEQPGWETDWVWRPQGG